MVKDPADKIREIKPFGPQLPKDGPYKYRRPWQSWTGGDKVKKKNEYTIGGKTYKYAKGGRAGFKSGSKENEKKEFETAVAKAKKIIKKNKKKSTDAMELFKNKFNKGGRVGLKSGSKGCKLAMKGKGRAYGKNS